MVITSKKTTIILFHIVGWIFFLYIIKMPKEVPFTGIFVISYIFLIAYFYLNSSWFVPVFLSKKQIAGFLGITVAAYMLFCFVIPLVFRHYFMIEPPFRPEMMPPFRPEFPPPERGTGLIELTRRFGFYSRSSQFLVVFIISTGVKVIAQWYAEKQRLQELEHSMVQAELSFLKSQIHPHFLFNSLNSIYYLALSKDDKAPEAILSLSDFLRFVTTESNNSRIPLGKETKMLEEYIHLQSLRASEKFELRFQLTGNFQEWTIMPLTFIPFVENAFKYGISAHIDCFIHIRIDINNDTLTFSCDNSIFTPAKKHNHSAGIGLDNIRKRLELAYPNKHSLSIDEDRLAFHVKLKINLANNELHCN
jgi:hypothetical protein